MLFSKTRLDSDVIIRKPKKTTEKITSLKSMMYISNVRIAVTYEHLWRETSYTYGPSNTIYTAQHN